MSTTRWAILAAAGFGIALARPAWSQVPVMDAANLAKAQEIASTTNQILTADQQIMSYTQKTLQAVTGDRSSQMGSLSQMALGGGFSLGSAPSLGSVISGGAMSFGGLGGGSQNIVSSLINGLQLVRTISGVLNGQTTVMDKSYTNLVNTTGTVAGMIDSTQNAVQSRASAFKTGAGMIGQAQDLKGSVDQNSQIMAQTGLTVNELIGAVNVASTAANQQNVDRMTLTSQATRALEYKPGGK